MTEERREKSRREEIERDREREREYTDQNSLYNIHYITYDKKIRACIYVSRTLWKKAVYIAKREGTSISNIIEKQFLNNWVPIHDPGNPQSRLSSFVEGGLTDQGAIEGRIRQKYLGRKEAVYRDILRDCQAEITDKKNALAMADRVSKWLNEKGVRIWR